jgi:hypothetical protein
MTHRTSSIDKDAQTTLSDFNSITTLKQHRFFVLDKKRR